jgi:ATP-dependent Clp protease ATP-binding subunit ClpX
MKKQQAHCTLCGRVQNDVQMLLQGVDGHVCSECIEQAHDLLNEELNGPVKGKGAKVKKAAYNVIKPMDMKVFLDQYVIGQDDAKKHLCVAVYNPL